VVKRTIYNLKALLQSGAFLLLLLHRHYGHLKKLLLKKRLLAWL